MKLSLSRGYFGVKVYLLSLQVKLNQRLSVLFINLINSHLIPGTHTLVVEMGVPPPPLLLKDSPEDKLPLVESMGRCSKERSWFGEEEEPAIRG